MKYLLAILALVFVVAVSGKKKTDACLGVKGHVKCTANSSKHKNVVVELVDDNWVKDEMVDQAFTTTNGYFQLQGCAKDGKFKKQIRLVHDCGSQAEKWIHKIPDDQTGVYNLGEINLSNDAKFPTGDRKKFSKALPTPCKKPKHHRHRRHIARFRRYINY